jgi:ectoine hydroxylase-related dioxygenase (phytanoyl-CoA dioxygenase family)
MRGRETRGVGTLPDEGVDWMRPAASPSEAKHQLDQNGFCVLGRLLNDGQITEMRDRIARQARYERERGLAGMDDAQLTSQNQYIYAIINKGRVFLDLFEMDLIHELITHLLGEDYLLSASDAVIAAPGVADMPLHTDQWWFPACALPDRPPRRTGSVKRFGLETSVDPRPTSREIAPPAVGNVMWAITDFSADNGGTRIVPRSHLAGVNPDPGVPHRIATIGIEMAAGQAVVFDGRLWHGTGANRTRDPRYGLLTTYCGPQFRQMENYPLMLRQELLDRASPRLRAILGFKVWQGYGKLDRPDLAMVSRHDPIIQCYDNAS